MSQRISISEARKKLNELLKDVKENPGNVYELTINEVVMGELSSPAEKNDDTLPGRSLTDAVDEMPAPDHEQSSTDSVADDHDRFLYGTS